jgi:hypothetical protein
LPFLSSTQESGLSDDPIRQASWKQAGRAKHCCSQPLGDTLLSQSLAMQVKEVLLCKQVISTDGTSVFLEPMINTVLYETPETLLEVPELRGGKIHEPDYTASL